MKSIDDTIGFSAKEIKRLPQILSSRIFSSMKYVFPSPRE